MNKMSNKDIMEYAPNSPLLKEMRKPQIMHIKQQNYGVRKRRNRIKNNRKGLRNG